MAGKFRGQSKWDPILIILQILTVQLLSYASITLLILFFTTMSGQSPSIAYIFNYKMIRLGTGKTVLLAHLANAFVGAYLLKVFVERSKLCLDFSLTHYAIHFILVWYQSGGMPDTFLWYFVNIVAIGIMCIASEFLCHQEEMKLIPISATV